jgi:excinuclease ABC subunit A
VKGWDRRNAYTFSLLESVARHYGFDIDARSRQRCPRRSRCCCTARATRTSSSSTAPKAPTAAAQRQAQAPLRRHHPQLRAPLPRDRLGRRARGPGALPGRQALPGLPRHAPEARGPPRVAGKGAPAGQRGKPSTRSSAATLAEALAYFDALELEGAKAEIADKVVREIRSRLRFLNDVGLPYLSLDRSADTLSGGEAQRIRLASQIGSGLSGVMYVLDEPSIGLHQRDNERLIGTLRHLRDLGNSVLVVEHDEDMIRAADHVVDMGPGAGVHGGA